MKKYISRLVAATLLLTTVSGTVNAQSDTVLTLSPVEVRTVNEKVLHAFHTKFKDAENPKWEVRKRSYIVDFRMASLPNLALFNRNGHMVHHIIYGNESTMPKDLLRQIKTNYVEANITGAVAVEQDNRQIWIITLVEGDRIITLRCEDGNLEEIKNLKSASV